MSLFNSLFNKKNFNASYIIETNLKTVVSKIEKEFNTKVLEYGIRDKEKSDLHKFLPFTFNIPDEARFICFMFIPIDENEMIITNDYWQKTQELRGLNPNVALDAMKIHSFFSSLRPDEDICNFIFNQFNGGNIFCRGNFEINPVNRIPSMVNGIENIDDARYRIYFYFIDDELCTL